MRRFLAKDNVVAPLFNRSRFVVPPGVTIEGGVNFDGEVRVEGHVQGEVRCLHAVIAPDGLVEGLVAADEVCVEGEVDGAIYATHLHLAAQCNVEGEIFHVDLTLDPGCYFEGKSRRHPNALQLAPREASSA